jgi:hypothetical protein
MPVRREYPPRAAASVRQTCAPLQRLSDYDECEIDENSPHRFTDCGRVGEISGGVVGGTPIGSGSEAGTCGGNGEGIPGGTSCCGVSGGVGVRAGPGLGFAGVGCGLLGSTCGFGFCI